MKRVIIILSADVDERGLANNGSYDEIAAKVGADFLNECNNIGYTHEMSVDHLSEHEKSRIITANCIHRGDDLRQAMLGDREAQLRTALQSLALSMRAATHYMHDAIASQSLREQADAAIEFVSALSPDDDDLSALSDMKES